MDTDDRLRAVAEEADRHVDVAPGRRVSARVTHGARSVFSLKVHEEELEEIANAAEAAGQSVGAFIRDAALEKARGRNNQAIAQIREKTRELAEAVSQL